MASVTTLVCQSVRLDYARVFKKQSYFFFLCIWLSLMRLWPWCKRRSRNAVLVTATNILHSQLIVLWLCWRLVTQPSRRVQREQTHHCQQETMNWTQLASSGHVDKL